MLYFTSDINHYVVYPSWAKIKYAWEMLPNIFHDPLSTIDPQKREFFDITPYDMTASTIEFIDGPEGGGIIVYVSPLFPKQNDITKHRKHWRWKGDIVFLRDIVDNNPLLGCPATTEYSSGVSYLTRHENNFLQKIEGEKLTRQFYIDGSFDHVESVGNQLYVALLSSKRKHVNDRAIEMMCHLAKSFGLDLTFIEKTPQTIKDEKPHWFRNKNDSFQWYSLHTNYNKVKQIFAFLLYCGLHLKKNCVTLEGIQLVGQIESQPQGRLLYHLTEEEEKAGFQRRKNAVDDLQKLLNEMPPNIKKRILGRKKKKGEK